MDPLTHHNHLHHHLSEASAEKPLSLEQWGFRLVLHVLRLLTVPRDTLSQARDGGMEGVCERVCEKSWQWSAVAAWRVLFRCNDPWGHMVIKQTTGCSHQVLSPVNPHTARWESQSVFAGEPNTMVVPKHRHPRPKHRAFSQHAHQWCHRQNHSTPYVPLLLLGPSSPGFFSVLSCDVIMEECLLISICCFLTLWLPSAFKHSFYSTVATAEAWDNVITSFYPFREGLVPCIGKNV